MERVLPQGHDIVVTRASSAEEAASILPKILDRAGPLEVSRPQDGETIEKGRVYVAAPDHHTLVENGRVRMARGLKITATGRRSIPFCASRRSLTARGWSA